MIILYKLYSSYINVQYFILYILDFSLYFVNIRKFMVLFVNFFNFISGVKKIEFVIYTNIYPIDSIV